MSDLLPLFLTLAGRDVVLVGGGPVATSKLEALVRAGARVRVIAPGVTPEIEAAGVDIARRAFVAADLDGAWLVVAAATPEVNREVAAAAEARRIFVNAVDDPANASAFLSGTVRRDGVTIAVSTNGRAPALTALLREDDPRLADAYSDTALRRVWRCTHFSWWMTTMLHRGGDEFDAQLQQSQLRWVVSSAAGATGLAENYAGLPIGY